MIYQGGDMGIGRRCAGGCEGQRVRKSRRALGTTGQGKKMAGSKMTEYITNWQTDNGTKKHKMF